MAIKPQVKALTGNSPAILNAIRNQATQDYREYVPVATPKAECVKEIGAVLMDYPNLRNEFINSLVNRIALVLVTSKVYDNPWTMFKKGVLELGETVEDVFVNLAEPFQFDPEVAESEVFKRQIPDVKAAFYTMNYQKFYKVTVSNEQIRQAFLSWDGVTDLIARIVDSMYTGANYDEFQVMKYMMAKKLLNGQVATKQIPSVATQNMKSIVSSIKGVSNALEFMTSKYNLAGVRTFAKKPEQYIIINAKFDAEMDVEVLASAFNMDKADFMGHRVLVDGFGDLDTDRLNAIFKDDPNYEEISAEDLAALNDIPAVLVDSNWFMIFDNLIEMTEQNNGQGLYWNYFYHTWKTFAVSPFANACAFVPAEPSITSVTVTPETATISAGKTLQMNVEVEANNFASKAVTWSVDDEDVATITPQGLLVTKAAGEVEVTATSVYDDTKSDAAVITVE